MARWRCDTGLIDSSGLKFYYTRTLRPHDAGIMELGLEYTDKMALPPRRPLWKLVGYCIPQCTSVVSDRDVVVSKRKYDYFSNPSDVQFSAKSSGKSLN